MNINEDFEMKLRHTRVIELSKTVLSDSGYLVEIVLSDRENTEEALDLITFRVEVPRDQNPLFAAIQKAALLRARELIDEQIRAMISVLNK